MPLSLIAKIDIDLAVPTGIVVHATQRESSGRVLELHLKNNGVAWPVPNDAIPIIRYYKSDRVGGFYDTDENGVYAFSYGRTRDILYVTLAYQTLTTPGNVSMKLNFYDNSDRMLATFNWTVVVEPSMIIDEEITSSPYYNILTNLISQAMHFNGAPRTAASSNDMIDQTLIYVYTGTTDSNYTNGHWYYWNGSAWTDGGVYNSVAINVDSTLTIAGAAADAKAVGDVINNFGNILTLDYVVVPSS